MDPGYYYYVTSSERDDTNQYGLDYDNDYSNDAYSSEDRIVSEEEQGVIFRVRKKRLFTLNLKFNLFWCFWQI